jgi:hypothetical protein
MNREKGDRGDHTTAPTWYAYERSAREAGRGGCGGGGMLGPWEDHGTQALAVSLTDRM